jgi:hypothetical protein
MVILLLPVKALQDLRRPDVDRAQRIGQAEVGQVYISTPGSALPPQAALLHGVMADGPFRLLQRQGSIIISCRLFLVIGQPVGLPACR